MADPSDAPHPSPAGAGGWRLHLLGRARVTPPLDEPRHLDRKAAALLAYLALQGPTSRGRLAFLLWPEHERAAARRNLRHWLFKLGRRGELVSGGDPLLLGPAVRVDLLELRGLARGDSQPGGAELIAELIGAGGGGAFLAGFEYDECPDLQEWVGVERAGALAVTRMVLEAEAEAAVTAGLVQRGIALMEVVCALDPLSEAALRRLLGMLAGAGRLSAARQRLDEARRRFHAELGAWPDLDLPAGPNGSPARLPETPLSELAEATRLLLLLAGPAFSVELAAGVLDARPETILNALVELRDRADPVPGPPGPEIRAYLHRRIAATLEEAGRSGADVAEHWIAGGEPVRAVRNLQDEAQRLVSAGQVGPAMEVYERAVELAGADDRLACEPLLSIDGLAGRTGDTARRAATLDRLERCAVALQDDALILETRLRRGDLLVALGRLDEAGTLAEIALDDAVRLRDGAARERARMLLGAVSFRQSRWPAAEQFFTAAARARDPQVRLRAITNLGSVQGMRGRYPESQRSFQRALTLARKLRADGIAASLLNNLAANAERLGWYARADQYLQEGVELAERSGEARGLVPALANQAMVRFQGGRLAGALESARRARELAEGASDPAPVALAALALGVVWRGLGRAEQARSELAAAVRIRAETGDQRGLAAARFNLEALALEEEPVHDPAAAEEALSILERVGPAHFAAAGWAELALLGEDPVRVREWAERAERSGHSAHKRMLTALARLRATLIEGTLSADTRDEEYLEEYLAGQVVSESPLAHLLMAELHARSGSPEDQRHARRAAALLEAQAWGLEEALAASRRGYIERRARLPERAATR